MRPLEPYLAGAHDYKRGNGIVNVLMTTRQFLEFGVENGLENNTLNLLEQGWSGAWLEGDPRYDAAHRWDGTDQFGASLESMTELGRRKGYQVVGCNITGANAFFVKTALAGDRLATPADTATLYLPARYFLTASFISGHRAGYSRKR